MASGVGEQKKRTLPAPSEGLFAGPAYSTDAICIGSLWCADRVLPRVMPTKNIAASNTTITPSFRGGVSIRICLSKSSWSCRSILMSPFVLIGNAAKLPPVSLTVAGRTLSSLIGGTISRSKMPLAINSRRKSINQHRAAESKGLSVAWCSPGACLGRTTSWRWVRRTTAVGA